MSDLKEQNLNYFIQLAIKKGFASASNVKGALDAVKEKRQRGDEVDVVTELVATGAMTAFQTDFLLKKMAKTTDITELEVSQDSIIDGYEIISNLGVGGMGTVYKARQVSMDRTVALKVLKEDLSSNDRYVMRFLKEAKTAGQINHQHVVNVYDVGNSEGLFYIAMEYIDGDNLKTILEKERQLSPDEAFTYAIQIARALRRMRENKIVHRDIKPENIFVTKTGRAKLGDLGIAKMEEDKGATQTRKGFVVGTFEYMSPEQATAEHVDFRSDIFSLGVMIYTLIAGENPFIDKTPADTVGNVLNKKPPSLTKFVPSFPHEASRVLSKMMAKERHDRYDSPEDLVRDLEVALWNIRTPAFKRHQEEEEEGDGVQKYLFTILFLIMVIAVIVTYFLVLHT